MSPEELLREAKALNLAGKHEDVIKLLGDETLSMLCNADLYAEKAQACYRSGKKGPCQEAVAAALRIDPTHAKACHYYGNYLNDEREYAKAIEVYQEVIRKDPENPDTYNGLGNAYLNLHEYDKAEEAYNKVLQIDPFYPFVYNGLGNLYYASGNMTRAVDSYEKAIQLSPRYVHSYNGLGNAYAALKEYKKAIEQYQKAIELQPAYINPYNGLGIAYQELQEFDKAIEYYNKVREIDPGYVKAYNGLGIAYRKLKNYAAAESSYNEGIRIDPRYNSIYYNRATMYSELKEYSKAIDDFKTYLSLATAEDEYYAAIAQSRIDELQKLLENSKYGDISEIVHKIKALLLFKGTCVTHYTGLMVSKALILDGSEFRLSEGAFLNDTSEGRELFKFLPPINTLVQGANGRDDTEAQPFVQKPFIGSFVAETKHDDLTLWRMYGKENKEEAKGCAITLDQEAFLEHIRKKMSPESSSSSNAEKTEEEFSFYRVAYCRHGERNCFTIPGAGEEEIRLNEHMEELRQEVAQFNRNKNEMADIQNLLELLNSIAYLFKSAEYHYEQELRLVVKGIGFEKKVDPALQPPRVYIALTPVGGLIRKITLGPKVERAEEWASAFYYSLDKDKWHPPILISHLPFK